MPNLRNLPLPGIPEPAPSIDALMETVLALKSAVEILMGRFGDDARSAKYSELVAQSQRFDDNLVSLLAAIALKLDSADYDVSVGAYTPAVEFSTPGDSSFAYGFQQGNYLKVGSVYVCRTSLSVTPTIGTGSGEVRIPGLPAVNGARISQGFVTELDADWTWGAGYTQVVASIPASVAYATLRKLGTAANSGTLQASDMTDGNAHSISFTGIMFT